MSIKLLALAAAAFITMTAAAQFKKGTRMVGASVGSIFFNSGSNDVSYPSSSLGYTANTTSFGAVISPFMGWFISDHTAVGASLNINPTSNKTTFENGGNTYQKDKLSSFNIGIGGFVRNYFGATSSWMPFGQFGMNAGISTQKTEGFFIASGNIYKSTYSGKSSGGFFANTALSVGMTKLLNPHTGLDLYAGYNFSYTKNTYRTTTLRDEGNNGTVDQTQVSDPTSKYTNHGFMINVGFQVFITR